MTFQGFGPGTVAFLAGLSAHNDKTWFDAHRADYDAHFVAPALAFAEALGGRLKKLDPNLCVDPRVNGNVFRINRDVRFSKDKTPYKDHLDMLFWSGERKRGSGFFFRITPDAIAVIRDAPHPSELGSKAFVPWCAAHCKALLPVHRFMDAVLREQG